MELDNLIDQLVKYREEYGNVKCLYFDTDRRKYVPIENAEVAEACKGTHGVKEGDCYITFD